MILKCMQLVDSLWIVVFEVWWHLGRIKSHQLRLLFHGSDQIVPRLDSWSKLLWPLTMLFSGPIPNSTSFSLTGDLSGVYSCLPGEEWTCLTGSPSPDIVEHHTHVGSLMLLIAATFSGSDCIPCFVRICPRNFTRLWWNSHFVLFKVSPASCSLFNTAQNHLSCFCWFLPETKISSMRHTTPSILFRMVDILLENVQELMLKFRKEVC